MRNNVILALTPLVLLVGCVAPRPDKLQKDSGTAYVDAQELVEKDVVEKAKVAVLTSTYADRDDQALAALLDAKITELLTSSARFEIAERAALASLKFEEIFTGTDSGVTIPTKSDFVLMAKIVSGSRIGMTIDFRFYEVAARKTIFSRTIPVAGRGRDILARSISEFAQSFADAFEPKVRVLQTRGNGMVARISRGLDAGVRPGMEVEFYEFDETVKGVNGARVRDTVGRGGVLECNGDTAWVEIDDYQLPSVRVRQGDYVEVMADPAQRRSRNFLTRFISRLSGVFN